MRPPCCPPLQGLVEYPSHPCERNLAVSMQLDVGAPSTNDAQVYEDSVEGDTSLYDESHRGGGCLGLVLETLSEKPERQRTRTRSKRQPGGGTPYGKPDAGSSLFVSFSALLLYTVQRPFAAHSSH